MARSLGFMVMGLVPGLTSHSDSESFLVVHALLSQDGCQRGFWEVVGRVVSPCDLSWPLLAGAVLLVPCSSPGPLVVKRLMRMVAVLPGQGGGFSHGASPNTENLLDQGIESTSPALAGWFFTF